MRLLSAKQPYERLQTLPVDFGIAMPIGMSSHLNISGIYQFISQDQVTRF